MYRVVIKIIAIALILGAVYHWLVISGHFHEKGPRFALWYFHSLAVINPLAAYGLWKLKKWGWYSVMYIVITQIIIHGYIMHEFFHDGKVIEAWRYADIIVNMITGIYLLLPSVCTLFFDKREV